MIVTLKETIMIIGEKNIMISEIIFTDFKNSNEISKSFYHNNIKWDIIVRIR